jgi:hypothetical protein
MLLLDLIEPFVQPLMLGIPGADSFTPPAPLCLKFGEYGAAGRLAFVGGLMLTAMLGNAPK